MEQRIGGKAGKGAIRVQTLRPGSRQRPSVDDRAGGRAVAIGTVGAGAENRDGHRPAAKPASALQGKLLVASPGSWRPGDGDGELPSRDQADRAGVFGDFLEEAIEAIEQIRCSLTVVP